MFFGMQLGRISGDVFASFLWKIIEGFRFLFFPLLQCISATACLVHHFFIPRACQYEPLAIITEQAIA